jgi:acetylornithine deacetylase/succinyl-diaminopimelate desuccinylase-like protein
LAALVRFPSVSADPRFAPQVKLCASWLARHLQQIGLDHVHVFPTPGHPIVYADWLRKPGRPTVLIYGHYDVQPADPYHEWQSPPFDPVVRAGSLYGRGACDDKGQMFAHVKALEVNLRRRGALPVNVRCLLEGEEEIGSPNLLPFLARNRRGLAVDVAVMSDSPMAGPERPAITYAVRGGLGLELTVLGPARDLHSGLYGGAVRNPLQVLCEIVAALHDQQGRIAVPGFYRRVRTVADEERAFMSRNTPPDRDLLRSAGVGRGWGEAGFRLQERTTIRPALTINGLRGGYQGTGGKAIIPASASAKLSFRLVPDQDPDEIERLFVRHLARITPPGVRCSVRRGSSARPAVMERNHPFVHAAVAACVAGFGKTPALLRMGGSIPVVSAFQRLLGVPTVLLGFAPPDARIHAPNEHFPLATFFRAIDSCSRFLHEVRRLFHGAKETRA